MNSLRVIIERNFRYIAVAVALLLVVALPVLTNAAQLAERSITLSSSSKSAAGVSYEIKFTTIAAADAFVIQFCSNSPLVGTDCTAPTGFSATTATSGTTGLTPTVVNANTVRVVAEEGSELDADDDVTFVLNNVTNPSTPGALYARVVTYDTAANAANYTATNAGAGAVDDGGFAVYIHDTIGVSAAVLESLTFCVSADEIDADCDNIVTPTLVLGEEIGTSGMYALSASEVSEGNLYGQLSTNAVGGAVVSLKSSAAGCGGLVRIGGEVGNCDIKPALVAGISAGDALFGLKLGAVTSADGATNPVGTIQAYSGSGYNDTTFALNFDGDELTGITSTFGDPFIDTAGAPVSNKNIQLIFGASVANDTPAGLYATDLSMIATGRF